MQSPIILLIAGFALATACAQSVPNGNTPEDIAARKAIQATPEATAARKAAARKAAAEMVPKWLAGEVSEAEARKVEWATVPPETWPAIQEKLLAKTPLTETDKKIIWAITSAKNGKFPKLAQERMDEVLAQYDPGDFNRYWLKYFRLAGDPVIGPVFPAVTAKMDAGELAALAGGRVAPWGKTEGGLKQEHLAGIREKILGRAQEHITLTRVKEGQATDAAAISAALAPVMDALNSPGFEGLQSALAGAGDPDAAIMTEPAPAKGLAAGKGMAAPARIELPETLSADPETAKAQVKAAAAIAGSAAFEEGTGHPVSDFHIKLNQWGRPHGAYLESLRAAMLRADQQGNTAERDRLLAIYEPWARKYFQTAKPSGR